MESLEVINRSMEAAVDYYATLRVDREADGAAIRLAYRKLMRSYHPDVNASEDAGARAKELNEAYSCLRDPRKRAVYDRRSQSSPGMAASTVYASAPRPFQPVWHTKHADLLHDGPPILKRWKAVALGLAAIVTIITFTLTSSVDTTGPGQAHAATLPRR